MLFIYPSWATSELIAFVERCCETTISDLELATHRPPIVFPSPQFDGVIPVQTPVQGNGSIVSALLNLNRACRVGAGADCVEPERTTTCPNLLLAINYSFWGSKLERWRT